MSFGTYLKFVFWRGAFLYVCAFSWICNGYTTNLDSNEMPREKTKLELTMLNTILKGILEAVTYKTAILQLLTSHLTPTE